MTMELEQSLKENKSDSVQSRPGLFRIILAVLVTATAGLALRYFEIDTYFIFLGFRFHLSAVLPFLILYNKNSISVLSEGLRRPYYKLKFLPFLWIIISLIIILSVLYFTKRLEMGDPDYFYEFGLSSIVDYPLYLIWNFPQLCLLFVSLVFISRSGRFSFLIAFISLIFLFFWEMIPFDLKINPAGFIPFISLTLIASYFITKLQNIYWFVIIVFSSVWAIILLFGSGSEIVINLFFAKEYNSWEGFLKPAKDIAAYIVPAYFLFLLIIVLLYMIFRRRNQSMP
jgi:diacylglycerol kinase